jgi:hypothetical protein
MENTDLPKIFDKALSKYEDRVLPLDWQARGILTSEGLAFCAIAEHLKTDLIIESGIFLGKSTEIWAKYFPKTRIVALDRQVQQQAVERLSKYRTEDRDITIRQGNSMDLLPQYVTGNKDKRISVFIDGPKGYDAVNLAMKILDEPNVQVVAIHDMHIISYGKLNPSRKYMKSFGRSQFYTDDENFVRKYCFLDLKDTGWDTGQNIRWIPYELVTLKNNKERYLGSYGPTMGFIWNE